MEIRQHDWSRSEIDVAYASIEFAQGLCIGRERGAVEHEGAPLRFVRVIRDHGDVRAATSPPRMSVESVLP